MLQRGMRCAFGIVFLALSPLSGAVAPGSLGDANTLDFGFVGKVNGASGVLVGPNLVLTARHVGAGLFTLPGVGSFNVFAGSVKNHETDDLTLFQIDTGVTVLTNYAQINVNSVVAGTVITMVGYGGTGQLNGTATGYDITGGGGIRRKASAVVEGTRFVDDPGFKLHSLYAPLRTNGQGALVGGDSGGGWFLQGGSDRAQLVAINSWIDAVGTGQFFMFSSDPNNYFTSGAGDLSAYNGWLVANGASVVPEPASLSALAIGLLAIARRRRLASVSELTPQ